ncbi:hypothetical protein B0H19DRAFT_1218391 [Mycena capillaripes]|nr:hypothetical protein B0H19DRAFT_1218391 [Mycena capillaripes]
MSAYKSFAVVGGGSIGLPVVIALASHNVSVILLSRPGSPPKTVPSTVEVVQVDYSDTTATAAVFKQHKVDVVLSTISFFALSAQKSLVDAAKLARVKLFLPSEFGAPSDGDPAGIHSRAGGIEAKQDIIEYLKSVKIPSLRIFTGLFTELIPWLVGHPEHGKVRIVGKGEAPVSFTSIADVAGFVAYILTTLPPNELENRILRLEGERASFNEIGELFKAPVEHVDRIMGEAGDVKTGLLALLCSGAGSTGWDEINGVERSGSEAAGSANALWSGHHWRSINEVLNL